MKQTPEKAGINAEKILKSGICWKKLEIDTLSQSPLFKEHERKT